MIFSVADLNRFDAAIQCGLDEHRVSSRLRQRYVRRRSQRLGPLCEAVKVHLEARRALMATESGREELTDDVCDTFRARREEFGVPIWVFAIILKVIASVIIDWWLLHSSEKA